MTLKQGQVCVVNAASYRDMEVFVAGLLQAEQQGKRFVYRTAASFVRVRGGMQEFPLLTHKELLSGAGEAGGLVIAGSYIRRSSEQIEAVRRLENVVSIEVPVQKVLDQAKRKEEIEAVCQKADSALREGKEALIYTSRELVTGKDEVHSLEIGQLISSALVEILRGISTRPAWMITKGGITSSDMATYGLNITKARVLGQVLPGVPVWRTGADSRWPGLTYVVFPGNVGGAGAIAQVVEKLRG